MMGGGLCRPGRSVDGEVGCCCISGCLEKGVLATAAAASSRAPEKMSPVYRGCRKNASTAGTGAFAAASRRDPENMSLLRYSACSATGVCTETGWYCCCCVGRTSGHTSGVAVRGSGSIGGSTVRLARGLLGRGVLERGCERSLPREAGEREDVFRPRRAGIVLSVSDPESVSESESLTGFLPRRGER